MIVTLSCELGGYLTLHIACSSVDTFLHLDTSEYMPGIVKFLMRTSYCDVM